MNPFSHKLLEGKRFLVLGATGGAGSTTARMIAICHGLLTVVGRDPNRVEQMRISLTGGIHKARYSLDAAFQDGPFDGIFDATGMEVVAPTAISNAETLQKVMDSSINGAVELTRYIGRRNSILKDGGSVVFMSSVAAVRGSPGMTIYAASKGAIEGLARSAAMEWSPRRIRVNCIRAGAFTGNMHSRITSRMTDGTVDDYAARHPLGFGRPDDIANMAVYLLSDLGRWITGQAFVVDGGYSAR